MKALREFVEVYRQPVYALCLKMLRHHQDAEDTAQESLARAIRYLESWDSSQPLTPWVMKIAANRCRTHLGKRQRTVGTTEHVSQIASTQTDSMCGLGEELQLALNLLADPQRECFCLFYLHELSIAEIAMQMQIPEGTVKTWLHRSRKQLAQRLRDRGVEPAQSRLSAQKRER